MKSTGKFWIVMIAVIVLTVAGSASAENYADANAKRARSQVWGQTPFWMHAGLSIGGWDIGGQGNGVTLSGVEFEIAVRPVKAKPEAEYQWAADVPFIFTVHQGSFDNFKLSFHVIPTARLSFKSENGMDFAPYLGFGAGVMFHASHATEEESSYDPSTGLDVYIGESFDNKFDLVTSLRLGVDMMVNEIFGFRINYQMSSVKFKGDYRVSGTGFDSGSLPFDKSVSFNQISLGVVFHP
jgi:hypothetical protein